MGGDTGDETSNETHMETSLFFKRTPQEWTQFVIVEPKDPGQRLSTKSPFAWSKYFQGVIAEPKSFKILRSGSFLIELDKKAHVEKLLKKEEMLEIPVHVSLHRSLNTSTGIFRNRDLWRMEDDEIKENLKEQGVISVRRIVVKKPNREPFRTNTFIVKFNTPVLPSSLKMLFQVYKVDQFIPNPLRCFRCQKFGHGVAYCHSPPICSQCGEDEHSFPGCDSPPHCVNCGGDHPAMSKECPKWQYEKQICELKTRHRLSYPEAQKMAGPYIGSAAAKYSTVLKPKMVDSSVQTVLSHIPKPSGLPVATTVDAGCQTMPTLEGTAVSVVPSAAKATTSTNSQKSTVSISTVTSRNKPTSSSASASITRKPDNLHLQSGRPSTLKPNPNKRTPDNTPKTSNKRVLETCPSPSSVDDLQLGAEAASLHVTNKKTEKKKPKINR